VGGEGKEKNGGKKGETARQVKLKTEQEKAIERAEKKRGDQPRHR